MDESRIEQTWRVELLKIEACCGSVSLFMEGIGIEPKQIEIRG